VGNARAAGHHRHRAGYEGQVDYGEGPVVRDPHSGKYRGLRFESLDAAQAYVDRWSECWADTRIHGATKRRVTATFAEERSALGPLPLESFRYYHCGTRTEHLDGCVEVEAAYYRGQWRWIGQRLQVQRTDLMLRLLDPKTGQLVREHVRASRVWHRVADADWPMRPRTKRLRC